MSLADTYMVLALSARHAPFEWLLGIALCIIAVGAIITYSSYKGD